MNQFSELSNDDPNAFLLNFSAICTSSRWTPVSDKAICLRLFPNSFTGSVRLWLNSLAPNSLTNWRKLAWKFFYWSTFLLLRFQVKNEITVLYQLKGLKISWENVPIKDNKNSIGLSSHMFSSHKMYLPPRF